MAKPSNLRGFFGGAVNALLPGTPYNRYSGQYSGAEVGKGILTGVIQGANPIAGQFADYARSHTGGTPKWDANIAARGWLQNQYNQGIKPQGGLPYMPSAEFAPVNPVGFTGYDPNAVETQPQAPQPQQGREQRQPLASLGGAPARDSRSGMSAGSHVLAEGQAAQDMVGDMQLASWLGMRAPTGPGPIRNRQS